MQTQANINTQQAAIHAGILATKVTGSAQRMDFLPSKLGSAQKGLRFEAIAYGWMDRLCMDYAGGMWQFYELSNGGFYMAPEYDKMRISVAGNYYDGEVSGDAAGVIATLFALNQLACQTHDDEMISAYHRLLEFADGHAERCEIFSAID